MRVLRRLTARQRLTPPLGEGIWNELDRLLRERRFVDLFAVVRGGLFASEPNYSLKSLEAFYDLVRAGEVTTAGGSVVAYKRWRETHEQRILDEIKDYNRIDCISTEALRDWLVGIRPAGAWPALAPEAALKEAEEDADAQALRDQGKPTLPSTLGRERAINPFLRTDQPSVQAAARARAGRSLATQAQVFAEIRGWKDQF